MMASNISERLITMQPLWGAWFVEELIGEGSYGKVYRIRRREQAFGIEQDAALKWIALPQREDDLIRLRSENMTDENIRTYYDGLIRTLRNEILLMSSLAGNSHIVNYADHQIVERQREIGWDILIRMEYLTPLDKHIMIAPLSERDVARVGIDICDALALCAQRKILHRDVKPDNIFISRDGNYKLGDFGVSRTMEKTVSHLSVKGAPMYMAPELYKLGEVDFSADTYSLGLVLYKLLNRNRMPFLPLQDLPTHFDRETALTHRLKGEMLPAPANGCREMKRIVLKACAYKRDQRFVSAEEMKEALEALVKREKLSTQNLMADTPRGNALSSERSPVRPPIPEGNPSGPGIALDQAPKQPPSAPAFAEHEGLTIPLSFGQGPADASAQENVPEDEGLTIPLPFERKPASVCNQETEPPEPEPVAREDENPPQAEAPAAADGPTTPPSVPESTNREEIPPQEKPEEMREESSPAPARKPVSCEDVPQEKPEEMREESSPASAREPVSHGEMLPKEPVTPPSVSNGKPDKSPKRRRGLTAWLVGIAVVLIACAAVYAFGGPEKLTQSITSSSLAGNFNASAMPNVFGEWTADEGDVRLQMSLDVNGQMRFSSYSTSGNQNADYTGSFTGEDQTLYLTLESATVRGYYNKNRDTITVNINGSSVTFRRK
jgi:serine/threonine protein kinase